ncbi:MAG: pyrroline-5-carboxylate reductase, partial [Oxalobacteraceae bacterium]
MKISFIGGGNMATAFIAGLVGKVPQPGDIHVVDPNPEALNKLHTQYGVDTASAIGAAVAASSVIVLAVKPQQMRDVAAQLQPHLTGQPLLLSIAAGIRGADLSRWLGGYGAIVRAMPNTPALIKKGITGMVAMAAVSADQKELADEVMRAVGDTLWLDDESQIDAVTAVSG